MDSGGGGDDVLGFPRLELTDSSVGRGVSSEGELGGGTATRGVSVLGNFKTVSRDGHGGSSANSVLVL